MNKLNNGKYPLNFSKMTKLTMEEYDANHPYRIAMNNDIFDTEKFLPKGITKPISKILNIPKSILNNEE